MAIQVEPHLQCSAMTGPGRRTRCLAFPEQHRPCACGRPDCARRGQPEIYDHAYLSVGVPCLGCRSAIYFSLGTWYNAYVTSTLSIRLGTVACPGGGSHRPSPSYLPAPLG